MALFATNVLFCYTFIFGLNVVMMTKHVQVMLTNVCMAPAYLAELCLPITASDSRRGGLRSAATSNLVIPRCRLSTYGSHAFIVDGPVCWNFLELFEVI